MKNENIKISFLGMKFECTNPTRKAIIILILLLTFFVVLVVLLREPTKKPRLSSRLSSHCSPQTMQSFFYSLNKKF